MHRKTYIKFQLDIAFEESLLWTHAYGGSQYLPGGW